MHGRDVDAGSGIVRDISGGGAMQMEAMVRGDGALRRWWRSEHLHSF